MTAQLHQVFKWQRQPRLVITGAVTEMPRRRAGRLRALDNAARPLAALAAGLAFAAILAVAALAAGVTFAAILAGLVLALAALARCFT